MKTMNIYRIRLPKNKFVDMSDSPNFYKSNKGKYFNVSIETAKYAAVQFGGEIEVNTVQKRSWKPNQ